jgi:hypothetical protein
LTSEDYTLLNELWTTIEREPSCTHARKVLVEQLVSFGWIEAALDAAQEILRIEPTDTAMADFVKQHGLEGSSSVIEDKAKKAKIRTTKTYRIEKVSVPKTDEERHKLELQFIDALAALQERALLLLRDVEVVTDMRRLEGQSISRDDEMDKLHALSNAHFKGITKQSSNSARAVARAIEEAGDHEKALVVALTDLEDVFSRLKLGSEPPNNDTIRETLAKRSRIIGSGLQSELQDVPQLALMHIEHEKLDRQYHNDESMFGDAISEIPREEFWTSEDGYAWSMDELSQAITSNGGVMRNPLSREMFSTTDIRRIIQHPQGKRLAAMQLEQSKMSKGVRPTTIEHLETMSKTFLSDMSEDQKASRQVLGKFLLIREEIMI